jgi:hypothetical protein
MDKRGERVSKNKYRAISNGKTYNCHACNFEAMTALVDVEGFHIPQWCKIEKFVQYIDMVDHHSNEIFEGMKVKERDKPEIWDVVWDEAVAAFEFVTEDRKHTWMPNFDYVAQSWEIVK